MFVVPQLNDKSIIKIFGRWTRILFLIASLIAIAVTLISFTGAGPLGPESNTIFWLLIFNFLLIAVLAINVLRNYFQLRSKSPEKGTGRLATQFATLFSFMRSRRYSSVSSSEALSTKQSTTGSLSVLKPLSKALQQYLAQTWNLWVTTFALIPALWRWI